jgi:chromate transport protein ChrA
MTTWFPNAINYLGTKSWVPLFTRGALAAVLGSILISVFRLSRNIEWNVVELIIFTILVVVVDRKWIPSWLAIPLGGIVQFMISRM